jgi:hypothetical protein
VVAPSGPKITAPTRLPSRVVRNVNAAAAAIARSRFSWSVVPKSRLALASNTIHVSSSRSAIVVRTWGVFVRAVRFQSMWRTSSPGEYSLPSPGSDPPAGTSPW